MQIIRNLHRTKMYCNSEKETAKKLRISVIQDALKLKQSSADRYFLPFF